MVTIEMMCGRPILIYCSVQFVAHASHGRELSEIAIK